MAIDPDDDLQWWINEAHLLRRQLAAARRARQVEENCRDLAERKLSSARRWARAWKQAAKLANGRVRLVFKTKLRDLKKEDE